MELERMEINSPIQILRSVGHALFRRTIADTQYPEIAFNATFPITYTIRQPATVEWSGGNEKPVNVSLSDGDIIQMLCSQSMPITSQLVMINSG